MLLNTENSYKTYTMLFSQNTLDEFHEIVNSEPINELDNLKQERKNMISAVIDSIKKGHFIVGSYTDAAGVSFSSRALIYTDATSARAECKRLASFHPGKLFMFVKLSGAELLPVSTSLSI